MRLLPEPLVSYVYLVNQETSMKKPVSDKTSARAAKLLVELKPEQLNQVKGGMCCACGMAQTLSQAN